MELLVRKETLFEGLNADERRRLFFLFSLIDQLEVREALPWAERIEAFIRGKTFSQSDPLDRSTNPAATADSKLRGIFGETISNSPLDNLAGADAATEQGEMVSEVATHVSSAALSSGASAPRPTLDKSSQVEFFKAIARGATNAELAAHFGLTKRQAHALRIGILRRARSAKSQTAPEPRQCGTDSPSSEQIEVDVVRFLRQVGDVVVKEGNVFAVNSILKLNFQELIARANTKRLQRGKPTFDSLKQSGPQPAKDADGG
jgi:hypothetical protein